MLCCMRTFWILKKNIVFVSSNCKFLSSFLMDNERKWLIINEIELFPWITYTMLCRKVVVIFHSQISEAFSRLEISTTQAKDRYCTVCGFYMNFKFDFLSVFSMITGCQSFIMVYLIIFMAGCIVILHTFLGAFDHCLLIIWTILLPLTGGN